MKKLFTVYCLLFTVSALFVSGCVVRTMPYTHERVDQTLEGNRGYLAGTPPPKEQGQRSPRQMVNIEIELPPHGSYEWEDNELTGNQGYIIGEPRSQKTAPIIEERQSKPEKILPETYAEPSPKITGTRPVIKQKAFKKEPIKEEVKLIQKYIVQKGDTLQKIAAKNEIYGDWRKWKKIYEANKERIKNPDKIKPDMELVIPRE